MYCKSRLMRFGSSPDSNNLIRSLSPRMYWLRKKRESWAFCFSTWALSSICCFSSCCNFSSVSICSCWRSRKERSASEIACSDSAKASLAWSLALSVLLISVFSDFNFCCNSARAASAWAFCCVRALLAPRLRHAVPPKARHSVADNNKRVGFCIQAYLDLPWLATALSAASIAAWSPR